jgi:hypothetical protein
MARNSQMRPHNAGLVGLSEKSPCLSYSIMFIAAYGVGQTPSAAPVTQSMKIASIAVPAVAGAIQLMLAHRAGQALTLA